MMGKCSGIQTDCVFCFFCLCFCVCFQLRRYKDLLGKKLPAGKQHTVKHDQHGKTTVSYMTDVKVTSMEKVNSLLNKAMSVRSVAATQCNEHSSRSHFVFRLGIDGRNAGLGQTVGGILNLVDLAGSERLSKSGATGDRLKETCAINKSLSTLGDVILSLNNGDAHVPFRNSKLTWLLQVRHPSLRRKTTFLSTRVTGKEREEENEAPQ